MTRDDFLAEIEPLTHTERTRRAVELGRRASTGDAAAKALIEALRASPEAYERLLALHTAHGTRDGAHVLDAVSDPSRTVRRSAHRMVATLCDDATAVAALDRIVERRALRRTAAHMARRGRGQVLETFLEARMERGPEPMILDLVPLASEALVTHFTTKIEEGGGEACWKLLAARHPALVARWFTEAVQRSRSLDVHLRWRILPRLVTLAARAPDAALTLMQALFDAGEAPFHLSAALTQLVRSRPRETFDLLEARHESGRPAHPPGAFGAVHFGPVAHRLGAERLDVLVRHAWSALGDGRAGVRWFLRLSEGDRKVVLAAFLDAGRGGWGAFLFRYLAATNDEERALRDQAFARWLPAAQAVDGTISADVLAFLPRDLREREARRHLHGCPVLASKPERRLVYARLLSFEDAKQVLGPFLGHPEGEVRARAQRILIATVTFDRAAMPAALESAKARKFEQDPVRHAIIETLATLPVTRYRAEHLDSAGGVIQDALDAADLSHATAAAVERWVVRLFRLDGAWGARWLSKLLAVRGTVSTWGLGDGLTGPEAARLAPALDELARTWATGERAGALITLAQSLGIRLGVVPPLLDALERLARELPFVGVAAAALDLLRKHARPRFARLAESLLAEDRSFILLPSVARHVSLSRQDLLAGLLDAAPMTGRFATGRTHWVIDFGIGSARWTARAQRMYAGGLLALLHDASRDVPTLRYAIDTLVRLPFADAAPLLPFAADARQPVREMIIRGLPWLDARQGVPVLIEALGDGRARWSIYALRKVFAELRRDEVLAELRAVPMTKVTVAKEVVRLYGELGGDEAYEALLAMDRPDLHRDVRVALIRALWDHLEKPRTWDVFARAVSSPDWIVAAKLADIPQDRLSKDAEARLVALLSALLGRAEPEARLDLLERAADLPLRDGERALFRRLLHHVGAPSTDEAVPAFSAVLQRMNDAEVSAVAARLCELIPERRHLVALVPVLAEKLGPYAQRVHVSVAEAWLAAQRADAAATPLYLTLGARLWSWKDLLAALLDLSKRDLLYQEAMAAALAAVGSSVHPSRLDEALQREADPRLRRLGLEGLLAAARPQEGWTTTQRTRLELYQRDPAPSVAGPASFVFPP